MRALLRVMMHICLFSCLVSCDNHELRETKYVNGQIQEQFYVLETDEGSFIKDGEYNTWYSSGQLESSGYYELGAKIDHWKYWFANGQLQKKCNYAKDTTSGQIDNEYFAMMRLDGEFQEWYKTGQKLEEGIKKRGKNIGEWISWHENGQKSEKLNYNQNGVKDGLQILWYENGQKSIEERLENGKRDGKLYYWDTQGDVYLERNFSKGLDVNLPAVYKNGTGEKLELNADGTYKLIYKYTSFFSSKWTSKKGEFEVSLNKLSLENFKDYSLKKFMNDSIVVTTWKNDIHFIKVEDNK